MLIYVYGVTSFQKKRRRSIRSAVLDSAYTCAFHRQMGDVAVPLEAGLPFCMAAMIFLLDFNLRNEDLH